MEEGEVDDSRESAVQLVEQIIDHTLQHPGQTLKSPEIQQKITVFLEAAKHLSGNKTKHPGKKAPVDRARSRLKADSHQRRRSVSVKRKSVTPPKSTRPEKQERRMNNPSPVCSDNVT